MSEDRLTEIEQMAESMEVSARDENIILELIQALRDERAKNTELERDNHLLKQEYEILENRFPEDYIRLHKNQKINIQDQRVELEAERQKVAELQKEINKFTILRPIEDIHEDHGEVLLWNLEIGDPPVTGCCLDSEFDESEYTHFSLIPNVKEGVE